MRESQDEWSMDGLNDVGINVDAEGEIGEDEDSPLRGAMVSVADALVEPPPERVRFTAPVAVRLESGGDTYLGAVLNLSARGVACTMPAEARTGERAWLKFQLGFVDDPLHLLCEVIWRSDRGSGDPVYGLRFASLAPDEEARVRAVVSERSEGRAGEWPLPVVPEPQERRRGGSTVVSAAAGMVAGIALALVLSVLPKAGVSQPPPRVASTTAATKPSPPPAAEREAREPAPAVIADAAPAPEIEPAAEPAPLRRHTVTPPAASEPTLRPLGAADAVEIALLVDGPVGEHTWFWMDGPRRLVVDVHGRKNGFAQRTLLIDHALATRIRVGQHPDKVRFVIEAAPDASPEVRTRTSGQALVVGIKRR